MWQNLCSLTPIFFFDRLLKFITQNWLQSSRAEPDIESIDITNFFADHFQSLIFISRERMKSLFM